MALAGLAGSDFPAAGSKLAVKALELMDLPWASLGPRGPREPHRPTGLLRGFVLLVLIRCEGSKLGNNGGVRICVHDAATNDLLERRLLLMLPRAMASTVSQRPRSHCSKRRTSPKELRGRTNGKFPLQAKHLDGRFAFFGPFSPRCCGRTPRE